MHHTYYTYVRTCCEITTLSDGVSTYTVVRTYVYLYYSLHPPPCTATVSVVPTEGRNEASNSAEDAETEESAGSQLDQASSQSAQAKEVSSVEQTAAEPYESEELAYEGESDVEKSAGRVARGEREGTPLQDENGEKGKTNKEDADNKEPDPVIDLHVSEPMDMEEIDEDVAPEMEKKGSAQTQEVAEPKKEVEQPSPSTEPHELLLERFTSRYLADIRPASAALRDMHCVY